MLLEANVKQQSYFEYFEVTPLESAEDGGHDCDVD